MSKTIKVLLLSESFMHYRKLLYNEFFKIFKENGYELNVYTDESFSTANDNINEFAFPLYRDEYNFQNIRYLIKNVNPSFIIFFWNIYSFTSWQIVFYLKINKIPFIYWSQGYSMLNPTNQIKGFAYKIMHYLSDSILLYSPNEKKYISSNHLHKVFVANNTINFNSLKFSGINKKELKIKYGIKFEKIVLFVGRIQSRKRLDVLINIFQNFTHNNIGLVIVGGGISKDYISKIGLTQNIKYLGEIYDNIDEIYRLADIFCIPGTNGLGINHAMYWGLPVFTLNVKHNPEIYYVKNGVNGYILNTEEELKNKIIDVLLDQKELNRLSSNASRIIREEASVEIMAKGFIDSLNYLKSKK